MSEVLSVALRVNIHQLQTCVLLLTAGFTCIYHFALLHDVFPCVRILTQNGGYGTIACHIKRNLIVQISLLSGRFRLRYFILGVLEFDQKQKNKCCCQLHDVVFGSPISLLTVPQSVAWPSTEMLGQNPNRKNI